MAETIAIIGLIGSVIAIIDGVDKSRLIWKRYFHSSASLRAELLPVLGKLTAFAGLLRGLQLQYELDEASVDRLQLLAHIEQPLKASQQAIRLISARLDQIASLGRVSFNFGKVLNRETAAALQILDQTKPILELALSADQITLVRSIEVYVRNVAEDLQHLRLEGESYYHDVTEQLHDIKAKATIDAEAKRKDDILAWISQANYSSNYHAARDAGGPVDASGNWFIAGDEFQDWITKEQPSRLLLTGISGSGKTVLCAKAMEYLAQRKAASGLKPIILYFFFDFNDSAKESVEGMIRALLLQLLLQTEGTPNSIQSLYDMQEGPVSTKPSTQTWLNLLSTCLHGLQNIFIFVDALDECAESEATLLRDSLNKLFSKVGDNVRWLLTCRPNEKAIDDLCCVGFRHTSMTSETVNKDIKVYLTTSLETDPKLLSFSKDAKNCIITEIAAKSSGMFRYAQCQLDAISKLRDRRTRNVKGVLQMMPRTISETYRRILSDSQQLEDWPIVERILLLVSFSTRPVTVAEVSEFAVLEDNMSNIEPEDRLDISDMLVAVNTMITVRDGVVTLAHKSVQDFLAEGDMPDDIHFLWRNADFVIARKCMQYLRIPQEPVINLSNIKDVKEPNITQLNALLQQYPFLDYAATRWPHHLSEKESQQTFVKYMAPTLSLTCKPNLWKAWLLLQRADIWDNQIQLAGILCEAFIRGAMVPGWSWGFWQQRQQYRVRADVDLQNISKPLLNVEGDNNHAHNHAYSADLLPQTGFWVRAKNSQKPSYGLPGLLTFEKGDLIFIIETGMWWHGALNDKTGSVASHNVERCQSSWNPRLSGHLYHELAILLLEVAFQRPLAADATILWGKILSDSDLARYLAQLKELTKRAGKKIGAEYGNIIKECLSHVHWLDDLVNTTITDIVDSQEMCMEKLHAPIIAMRTSGFKASRRPIKRLINTQNRQFLPGDVLGQSRSAIGPNLYGSRASNTDYRATSAGPTRFSETTVVSRSATYSSATTSESQYRPHSTSAIAISYGTSVSTHMSYRPGSSQRPVTTTMSSLSSGPGANETMQKRSTPMETALKVMDALPEDAEPAFQTSVTSTNSNLAVMLPEPGPTTTITNSAAVQTSSVNGSAAPQHQYLFTADIDRSCVSWESPAQLTYTIFPNSNTKPSDIRLSDEDTGKLLQSTREAVLGGNDVDTQLAWASDVLDYINVADLNTTRAEKALSLERRVADTYEGMLRGVIDIISSLANQEYPQALYMQAKCREFGMLGYEVDKEKSLEQYKIAAQKSHGHSIYRAAVMLEAAGKIDECRSFYDQGCQINSAGARYREAMRVIQGDHGEVQDISKGMILLLQAADLADREEPQALFVAGLIFAHEFPPLEGVENHVTLDYERAVGYFQKAARYGFGKAQLRLAVAYELAELGLKLSMPLALHYYILAARRGQSYAEMNISRIMLLMSHDEGNQGPLAGAAFTYAKRAALDGLANAQFTIGYFYEIGIHVNVPEKHALALEWYEKAAAQGFEGATERIAALKKNMKSSVAERTDNRTEMSRRPNHDHHQQPSMSGIQLQAIDSIQVPQQPASNRSTRHDDTTVSPSSRPPVTGSHTMPAKQLTVSSLPKKPPKKSTRFSLFRRADSLINER